MGFEEEKQKKEAKLIDSILTKPIEDVVEATEITFDKYNRRPEVAHIVNGLRLTNPLVQLPTDHSSFKQKTGLGIVAGVSPDGAEFVSSFSQEEMTRLGLIQLLTDGNSKSDQILYSRLGYRYDYCYAILPHERVHAQITEPLHKLYKVDRALNRLTAGKDNSINFFEEILARMVVAEYFGDAPQSTINEIEMQASLTMAQMETIDSLVNQQTGIRPGNRLYNKEFARVFSESEIYLSTLNFTNALISARAEGKDYIAIARATADRIARDYSTYEAVSNLSLSEIEVIFSAIATDTPPTLPPLAHGDLNSSDNRRLLRNLFDHPTTEEEQKGLKTDVQNEDKILNHLKGLSELGVEAMTISEKAKEAGEGVYPQKTGRFETVVVLKQNDKLVSKMYLTPDTVETVRRTLDDLVATVSEELNHIPPWKKRIEKFLQEYIPGYEGAETRLTILTKMLTQYSDEFAKGGFVDFHLFAPIRAISKAGDILKLDSKQIDQLIPKMTLTD